jgi:hypothetical protein
VLWPPRALGVEQRVARVPRHGMGCTVASLRLRPSGWRRRSAGRGPDVGVEMASSHTLVPRLDAKELTRAASLQFPPLAFPAYTCFSYATRCIFSIRIPEESMDIACATTCSTVSFLEWYRSLCPVRALKPNGVHVRCILRCVLSYITPNLSEVDKRCQLKREHTPVFSCRRSCAFSL